MPDGPVFAGVLLLGGSLAFLVGAGNPILARAWVAPEPTFLAIVAAHGTAWRFTNSLFIAATVATNAGLMVASVGLGPKGGDVAIAATANQVTFAIAGAANRMPAESSAAFNAEIPYLQFKFFRMSVTRGEALARAAGAAPALGYSVGSQWAGALFAAFTLLAGVALVVVGAAIVMGGALASWVGMQSIAFGAVVVFGYLRFGDMPPFVSYLPTGVIGLALVAGLH